jgi:hypothetical protein
MNDARRRPRRKDDTIMLTNPNDARPGKPIATRQPRPEGVHGAEGREHRCCVCQTVQRQPSAPPGWFALAQYAADHVHSLGLTCSLKCLLHAVARAYEAERPASQWKPDSPQFLAIGSARQRMPGNAAARDRGGKGPRQ